MYRKSTNQSCGTWCLFYSVSLLYKFEMLLTSWWRTVCVLFVISPFWHGLSLKTRPPCLVRFHIYFSIILLLDIFTESVRLFFSSRRPARCRYDGSEIYIKCPMCQPRSSLSISTYIIRYQIFIEISSTVIRRNWVTNKQIGI